MALGSPLGFNIHLAYVAWGKMIERMQALQPRAVVGFVDSDNDIDKVKALKAALPNTLVIGRVYLKDGVEGKFHLAPEAPGDVREYIASPQDAVNRWGAMGKGGMSLNVLNEPGTADDPKIKRLVMWTCAALDDGDLTQTALTVLNLATGQPGLNVTGAQWDARFDDVLKALSKYRTLHTLGLHEYLPESGRIGRFKAMIARCKVLGIQPPRIVITEFGVDSSPGESVNGYKSRDWSGDEYAMRLIELVERVYRPVLDDGTLAGLCVFSYGNSGAWANYDVENNKEFWDTLTNWHYQPASPAVVIPTPIPSPLHGEGNKIPAPTVHNQTTVQPAAPDVHAVTTSEPPQIANKYAKVAALLRQLADELERLDAA